MEDLNKFEMSNKIDIEYSKKNDDWLSNFFNTNITELDTIYCNDISIEY